MERLVQDIRLGVRSLIKSRRFTIAAVLTLALGIGANTAMFSVIRAVLLRSWPFPDPGRVVVVLQQQANGNANLFSTRDFLDWKQQGGLLARMGAQVSWQFNLSGAGAPPERVLGAQVSYDWLPTLGVAPVLGRLFSPQEDVAGAGSFVLLSSALWMGRYGGDREIVGKVIPIDGKPTTVLGVLPDGFHGFSNQELLWTPLQLRRDTGIGASPNLHWLAGCIRLPKGDSLLQARAALNAIAARLHRDNPTADAGFGVSLQTLNDAVAGNVRPALLMLMGCVGFVLLIACANVANLMLARGAARQREMAVRTALGAPRWRIVRQLLTESVLLAGIGGVLGIGLAFGLLRGMLAIHPPTVPGIELTSIDGAVLLVSLLVSVTVGILFGLVPAMDAARVNMNDSLRERAGSQNPPRGRTRSILVIGETALACMLLIGAGLALKSLWALKSVQLGFEPQDVFLFRIAAPAQLTGARISDIYRDAAAGVRAIPGVESAAVARDFPLGGVDPSMPVETDGRAANLAQGDLVTRFRTIGADYFRTLHIALAAGRAFNEQDTATSAPVAIVSESLAREYWPGESAVGKRIKPRWPGGSWFTVVGVAGDVRHWGAGLDIEPTVYYPYSQVPDNLRPVVEANMGIAVRSRLATNDLLHSIQTAVARVSMQVPVYQARTMESMVADSDSLRSFDLVLLGGFSLLALALAAVGVYAVMAYSVSQRTREIGIRIALGAHARDVLRMILRQGTQLAIAGSVAGVIAALLLRKLMASFLYGLSGSDPLVLALVPIGMMGIILAASWLPARSATRIDPITALRCE